MKEFINNNFFEITMICIIIVLCLSWFIIFTNTNNECKKGNNSWVCKPIQEIYKWVSNKCE